MDSDNYEQMGTSELRKLIRERGLGSGLALSSANKNECISLLRGETSWRDYEAVKAAAPEAPSEPAADAEPDASSYETEMSTN